MSKLVYPNDGIYKHCRNDIDNINTTLSQSLTQLISGIINVVGMLIAMLMLNPYLTLIGLVNTPITIFITRKLIAKTQPLFVKKQNTLGDLNGYIEEMISGQKPVITKAKKSIAGFKVREGHKIGCKVTLRGDKMYNFLDKLISISLPRVRDFRGLSSKSFDGRGNYTIGIKEQIIFPEINFDEVEKVRGMDVVIVTTAKTNEEAFDLLKELGVPFRK